MQEHREKPKILVVVGQTASGKSALGVMLAKHFSGEVISADSRQVYIGLDIGSGKITPEEMEGVPHHLIDIRKITEPAYTAAAFKLDSEHAIVEIQARGNLPIVVGGTFFYIDMLLGKTGAAAVPPNPRLRAHLETMTKEALFASLQAADPRRAQEIDKDNKVRLVRALEIVHALGAVPPQPTSTAYDSYTIGIDIAKEELHEKIHTRLVSRIEHNMIEEVEGLLISGVPAERLISLGLEYRYITEFLQGTLTRDKMLETLETEIRHFAKRQMTWLKRDTTIHWYKKSDFGKAIEDVKHWLHT